MQEFEFQIIGINRKEFRKLLLSVGGVRKHPMTKLRRSVYDLCQNPALGFVRVRSEADGVTMTSKLYHDKNFPKEYEVKLDAENTFDGGRAFLESLQLPHRAYQETYRETWDVPVQGVREVTIDLWPGLPPYAEVDCESKEVMQKMIKDLRVPADKIAYGPSATKYEHYWGIDQKTINQKTPMLTFKDAHKQLHPQKKQKLFLRICKKYRHL